MVSAFTFLQEKSIVYWFIPGSEWSLYVISLKFVGIFQVLAGPALTEALAVNVLTGGRDGEGDLDLVPIFTFVRVSVGMP